MILIRPSCKGEGFGMPLACRTDSMKAETGSLSNKTRWLTPCWPPRRNQLTANETVTFQVMSSRSRPAAGALDRAWGFAARKLP